MIMAITAATWVATPSVRKAAQLVMLEASLPKFMPKKPVIQARGMKIVATIVRRFITSFRRFDTVEQVYVHGAGEQVAVAVYQVADADQVVVHISVVPLGLARHAWHLDDAGDQAGKQSRSGVMTLRHVTSRRLRLKISWSCASSGFWNTPFSSWSMRSSSLGELGEEAVDEGIDHGIEDHRPLGSTHPFGGRPAAQLLEGRAVVVMDCDEGRRRPGTAVHLHERVGVAVGAERHEEEEVVELLQLGALPEVLRVFHGQGVKVEEVAEHLEIGGRGLM